jgi:hypothetical protein
MALFKVNTSHVARTALAGAYIACSVCVIFVAPNYYTPASTMIRAFFFTSAPFFIAFGFRQIHRGNAFGFVMLLFGLLNICVLNALSMHDCEGN